MGREFASDTNSNASHFASDAVGLFAPYAKLGQMKPLTTHLRQARKDAKLTLEEVSADLARQGIDLSPGQLSRLERGESDVSQERLKQLGRLYDWTPAELLAGRGSEDSERPRRRAVPLISRVQAGHWTEVANPHEDAIAERWITPPNHVGPRAFALEVAGQSMLPEFDDRDIIIVDPDLTPRPGHYVVAVVDRENEATFKKYRVKGADKRGQPIVELVPLNPDWPVLTLDKGGRILGVVTDHIRRLI